MELKYNETLLKKGHSVTTEILQKGFPKSIVHARGRFIVLLIERKELAHSYSMAFVEKVINSAKLKALLSTGIDYQISFVGLSPEAMVEKATSQFNRNDLEEPLKNTSKNAQTDCKKDYP